MNKPALIPEDEAIAFYEPGPTLKSLIGKSVMLSDIFTEEKIAACQKMIDTAKDKFFDAAEIEMGAINQTMTEATAEKYSDFCQLLFQPVMNIKSQAELFGFPLISRICKYLVEYCENSIPTQPMTARDAFIIGKLVEALRRALQERIIDTGGTIEKELISVLEQVKKAT